MDLEERIKRATAQTQLIKEFIDKGIIPEELLKMKEKKKMTDDQFHEFLLFACQFADGSIKATTERNPDTGEIVTTLDFDSKNK